MRKLTQGIEVGVDPTHNFFLVNGRRDDYLAILLTTLKAYLVLILERNQITDPKKTAAQSILNGKVEGDFIHIEIPNEMRTEKDKVWIIFMTVEGIHEFFVKIILP